MYSCAGLTCTFDGNGSTDDAGIASYVWDFGDGQGDSGPVVGHTYASGGTFTVRLTVTDTAGQTNTARSESVTSDEQVAYSGTAGYYRWLVSSYNGSGSYSLWSQRP